MRLYTNVLFILIIITAIIIIIVVLVVAVVVTIAIITVTVMNMLMISRYNYKKRRFDDFLHEFSSVNPCGPLSFWSMLFVIQALKHCMYLLSWIMLFAVPVVKCCACLCWSMLFNGYASAKVLFHCYASVEVMCVMQALKCWITRFGFSHTEVCRDFDATSWVRSLNNAINDTFDCLKHVLYLLLKCFSSSLNVLLFTFLVFVRIVLPCKEFFITYPSFSFLLFLTPYTLLFLIPLLFFFFSFSFRRLFFFSFLILFFVRSFLFFFSYPHCSSSVQIFPRKHLIVFTYHFVYFFPLFTLGSEYWL